MWWRESGAIGCSSGATDRGGGAWPGAPMCGQGSLWLGYTEEAPCGWGSRQCGLRSACGGHVGVESKTMVHEERGK